MPGRRPPPPPLPGPSDRPGEDPIVVRLLEENRKLGLQLEESTTRIRELEKRIEHLSAEAQPSEAPAEPARPAEEDREDVPLNLRKLLQFNRELQEEADGLREEVELLRDRAQEEEVRVTEAVRGSRERAETEVASLRSQLQARTDEISSLKAQLTAQGRTPFLSPEHVSRLLDQFHTSISQGFSGLSVRESEVRLKVAFGGLTPDSGGIMVPTTENLPELREGLSEVVLKLGPTPTRP